MGLITVAQCSSVVSLEVDPWWAFSSAGVLAGQEGLLEEACPSHALSCHASHDALLTQFHVDKKGRVNFAQTELLIHVVNRDTNRILDVDRWVCICAQLSVCLPPTLELGLSAFPDPGVGEQGNTIMAAVMGGSHPGVGRAGREKVCEQRDLP